jgi:hypothetical protein
LGDGVPECGSDERIEIEMTVWGELHPYGTEIDGDHEWTDESPCRCAECEHAGTVRDFRTDLD